MMVFLKGARTMTVSTSAAAFFWLLVLVLSVTASGFTTGSMPPAFVASQSTVANDRRVPTKLLAEATITESGFENKMPSSLEAESIGVREWPRQVKMGRWTERFDAGQIAARYVLEGAGMVVVTLFENDGLTPKVEIPEEYRVVPGNLVELMGPCQLEWQTDEDAEMVILTPGYEQGSLFAAVAALFVVLCGALIAGVGN